MLFKSCRFFLADQRGVTLVELIVSVGIFALLIGSITAILTTGLRSKDVIYEQLLTQSQGRKVLDNFVNELRGANNSSSGGYPLAEASSTEIIFYSNLDQGGLMERVRYYVDGHSLKKGVIKPAGNPPQYKSQDESTSTVAESIVVTTTPIFTYYDQGWSGTSTPLAQPVNVTNVRLVEIQFQLDRNPVLSPTALNMQSKVELRNLKTN